MFSFFNKNIQVISYTFFKYFELILTAVLMLVLADKIGPVEMGYSISSLLYITYSSYLAFGMNTLIIKNYKRENNKIGFLTCNFQFLFCVGLLNFVFTFFIFDKTIFYLISIISIANLFRSFFMSYYRVINKIWVLNINNIFLSSFLLISTFFLVDYWSEYLLIWSIIVSLSLILFVFFDIMVFKELFNEFFNLPNFIVLFRSFKEGAKLALVAGVGTVLLTTDRLLINSLAISDTIKGSYQFADNLSTAIFIGFSSVIFYFTPDWINKINEDKSFFIYLNKIVNYGLLIIPIVSIFAYNIVGFLHKFWFLEYQDLPKFVLLTLILKLIILLSGIYTLVYIGLNDEIKFLKLSTIPLSFLVILYFYVKFYMCENSFIFIPVLISLNVLLMIFLQKLDLKKNYYK